MPCFPEHLWERIHVDESGCWICDTAVIDGYPVARVGGKTWRCHRLMWVSLHGPIPGGLLVMHICDVRNCVNPMHLRLGTNNDNMADGAIKNRFIHKLEFQDIRRIRQLYECGCRQTVIAQRFNINQGHVSRIISHKRRQHVS